VCPCLKAANIAIGDIPALGLEDITLGLKNVLNFIVLLLEWVEWFVYMT